MLIFLVEQVFNLNKFVSRVKLQYLDQNVRL